MSIAKPAYIEVSGGKITKGALCTIMEGKQLQSGNIIGFGNNNVQNNVQNNNY